MPRKRALLITSQVAAPKLPSVSGRLATTGKLSVGPSAPACLGARALIHEGSRAGVIIELEPDGAGSTVVTVVEDGMSVPRSAINAATTQAVHITVAAPPNRG